MVTKPPKMRQIKFRGQMTTGEWVYGLPYLDLPGSTLYFNECSYRIVWHQATGGVSSAPIKNGTLGQFTGLLDKNETSICLYEGDIVDLYGNLIGNKYESEGLLKQETNLLIEGMGTSSWRNTEQKAMEYGCKYSE